MDTPSTAPAPAESIYAKQLREAKERRQAALAMRKHEPPKKYREIGQALGVSTERARQMVEQAEREAATG